MKRFVLCMGIVLAMGLSGCKSVLPEKKPDLEKSFSAEIRLKIGNENISGSISRIDENCWTLEIAEPYALEGLTVTMNEEGTKLSMLGFEAAADFSDCAVSGLKHIARVYEIAADNSEGFAENAFVGTDGSGEYTVYLDESGNLKGIRTESIIAELSGWTEKEAEIITLSEENDFVIE